MYDVLIIGGGPCGVSAGIYLKRAGYDVAIIEKSFIGGQIGLSTELVNYAGFIEKDSFIFCQNLTKQLKEYDIPIIFAEVVKISRQRDMNFLIQTTNGEYSSRSCIISIGAENRKLGFNDEEKFIGRGVSYCAICDGNRYKNKDVLVIGGGNSAFEDALYLSKICNKVYLIHRTNTFRAELYLQNEVNSLSTSNGGNVEILPFTQIKQIIGEDVIQSVVVNNNGKEINIDVQGVFIAIGREPKSNFLQGFVNMDNNYVIVDENFKTSCDGVYAGGDCINKKVRQVVTAVSDGAIIAKNVASYLQNKRG